MGIQIYMYEYILVDSYSNETILIHITLPHNLDRCTLTFARPLSIPFSKRAIVFPRSSGASHRDEIRVSCNASDVESTRMRLV